ncbi:1-(5-phosphoribosyl)-5-[(5-phosphoribosylamino)methylideneamino]imidazole-4-carboxamide isomerase [Methanocella sp. CWC-04]|uniref:1-(5-phosphoribosyl)-5-[(5-phosphoribosylamino)methylideneamino] imidazole-4-carboxamide isomerase n=1 Tax=Methanooceanicella nereidis TaxID=2052831 RepID=A0AAP2RDU0_9EURY|nr:1-(5-phosphoribosyl)-5-[(5-phosphoribosylamino)methylideneamino]imidazole-4-carboxamide isomerase [Methanocella sp. CWC-04]MCD1295804.1 1-(5-phosphoribosyl)-5-[(5-phosphoribosylamino)methylideneamino]imidazole-4-carboxamide isomerase [Methanocella sp. CWC-04]
MNFEVIPAIDLKGGKCVQLVQGVPGTEMVSLDDALAVADDWVSQGARTLHVIDLDGAFSGERKNAKIVEQIIKKYDVNVQVGGGVRDFETAKYLLDIGVTRVILGTSAVKTPELISDLSSRLGKEKIMVSLDSRKGEVLVDGWTASSGKGTVDLARQFETKGAGSILFTNVDVEGLLKGVDENPVRSLVSSVDIPVIASGGITTLEDIVKIKNTGAAGVVIGSALYKHLFTLKEAIEVVS